MTAPELRTALLVLRGFRADDLDDFAAMQADPWTMRHLGAGAAHGATRSRAETWASMAGFCGQWVLRGYGVWAIEAEGRFAGRCGFLHPEGWPDVELAYALAPWARGRGLMTEAARAALEWGFAHIAATRLVSYVKPDNAESLAVLRRLGATPLDALDLFGIAAERWLHAPSP